MRVRGQTQRSTACLPCRWLPGGRCHALTEHMLRRGQALPVAVIALPRNALLLTRWPAAGIALPASLGCRCAGFNLDSFMMRYQGVNWLDQANWHCNKRCAQGWRRGWGSRWRGMDGPQVHRRPMVRCVHTSYLDQPHLACCHASLLCCRANPYGEHYLDGISLNPFEVLFVKARRSCCTMRQGLVAACWRRRSSRIEGQQLRALLRSAQSLSMLPGFAASPRRSRSACCRMTGPLRCKPSSTPTGWRCRQGMQQQGGKGGAAGRAGGRAAQHGSAAWQGQHNGCFW